MGNAEQIISYEANGNGSYDNDLTWIWRLYMRNISRFDADGVQFNFAKAPNCRFRIRLNAKVFTVNRFSSRVRVCVGPR